MSNEAVEGWGAVVLLDALGVRTYEPDDCKKFLNERSAFLEVLETASKGMVKTGQQYFPDLDHPRILAFGDTILLRWALPKDVDETSGLSTERFLPPLCNLLSLSLSRALITGLFFRGAVTIGPYVEDSISVIGPAVSDVANWYEAIQFIGVVATPICGMRIRLADEWRTGVGTAPPDNWFKNYDVPIKGGKKASLYTVPWPIDFLRIADEISREPQAYSDPINKLPSKSQILHYLSNWARGIPKDTEDKYFNTVSFFEDLERGKLK